MLSTKCIYEYKKQYKNDDCFLRMTDGIVTIESKNQDKLFECPKEETDEIFFDRLERSKKIGRNLFYEEWKVFEYDPNGIY